MKMLLAFHKVKKGEKFRLSGALIQDPLLAGQMQNHLSYAIVTLVRIHDKNQIAIILLVWAEIFKKTKIHIVFVKLINFKIKIIDNNILSMFALFTVSQLI